MIFKYKYYFIVVYVGLEIENRNFDYINLIVKEFKIIFWKCSFLNEVGFLKLNGKVNGRMI